MSLQFHAPLRSHGATGARAESRSGVSKQAQSFGYFEPSLTTQFLPRCQKCYSPHPIAQGVESRNCLECGLFIDPPGPEVHVPAVIAGKRPSILAARALLSIGRALGKLAERL
jgi:hypothetical protein